MKNERGFSLIVLVITIIVIIILAAITLNSSDEVIEDSLEAKKAAEAAVDDNKIKEIMTYELAGTYELIDVEIDLKRVELNENMQIVYDGVTYGYGYALYMTEEDSEKVEAKTGVVDYYKSYKDLTKSYVVDYTTGDYKRLEEDWKFKN